MVDVIIFGNVPLATWVIKTVYTSSSLRLLGVVCDEYDADFFYHHRLEEKSVWSHVIDHNIPIIPFDEIPALISNKNVFGISIRYDKLFKSSFIESFSYGIINLHGGELPRFRGSYIANFAILEMVERGAGTIHYIDKGVDTGDIVIREYFTVSADETAYSYFLKTLYALKVAFKKLLHVIEHKGIEKIPSIQQSKLIENGEVAKTYMRKDIKGLKEVDLNKHTREDLNRISRAFYFPPHEPAYLKVDNQKVYLLPEEWKF